MMTLNTYNGAGSVAMLHRTWKQSRMHLASTERVLYGQNAEKKE
ncbi:hypothetical protein PC114_g25557 [Phytophthora cactorum]|nr:hypothetical protein PC114_g25557 [Phytophthora cactorum]